MSALTYGVVRVDVENSLTSLTLQDAGQVLPGGKLVLWKRFLKSAHIFSINV